MRRLSILIGLCTLLVLGSYVETLASEADGYDSMTRTDVLVVGATPCGISAAIAAARCGSKVILAEPQDFLGGMLTNGLGRTDIGPRHTVGGIFREFIGNVQDFYTEKYGADSQQVKDCGNGYWFEPSTAETILKRMVKAERNIDLRYRYQLDSVLKYGNRIHGVTFIDRDGRRIQIRAGVCIDATYEGDIAALSGAAYRVGRESRDEIGEPYAGVIYLDHLTRMVLPGSTGKGDKRVQAYNFRLTLTKKPDNRVIPSKPDSYDASDYADLLQSIKSGRVQTFADVIETRTLPNEKFDANNMPKSLQSTDLPVENYDYAENSLEDRAKFYDRLRDYTLGLIYFLQNDPEIPEKLRADASQWGLAKDEYPKNNHFPRQVYVREGRRIQGLYAFTMHDAELAPGLLRSPVHWDSVASGGYSIDSHATRKHESGHDAELEGFFWLSGITQPYQIPYRVMLPQTVDALLVPGAASATHLGFGTLRMEPVWMALG
ncbi:MAG TPA: FAD-dependent oxidoreductase, partial [Armatimonadota bacterium]